MPQSLESIPGSTSGGPADPTGCWGATDRAFAFFGRVDMTKPTAALLLGAGWSAAAGYALARQLLRGRVLVGTVGAQRRVQVVLDAFAMWRSHTPDPYVERFLAEVRLGAITHPATTSPETQRPLFDPSEWTPLDWGWAVEAVCLQLSYRLDPEWGSRPSEAVLVPERQQNRVRYQARVTSPARSKPHVNFLRCVLEAHDLIGAVTTNYDTLAERVLRHRRLRNEPEPGFFYGGLPRPQALMGSSPWDWVNEDDWSPGTRAIPVSGQLPLCKLHGSLNWELADGAVTTWRDNRLPYRRGGQAAIVAPVPEKEPDSWLRPVWGVAEEVLSRADVWIVVGYSVPEYDQAIRALLRRSAEKAVRRVFVHDLDPLNQIPVWRELVGDIEVRPGPPIAATRWAVPRPHWWAASWIGHALDQRSERFDPALVTPETWAEGQPSAPKSPEDD